jgi:hypothetical protein
MPEAAELLDTDTSMNGLYGRIEHSYCDPFAEAFDASANFRDWLLARLGLSDWVGRSTSLKLEQRAARRARFWWKNYYCHESRCTCPSLAGREIDILLFCRRDDGRTLAIHVECKQPSDAFRGGQAKAYPVRSRCWALGSGGPRSLLLHDRATTVLICDRASSYSLDDVEHFENIIYFDELSARIIPYPAAL